MHKEHDLRAPDRDDEDWAEENTLNTAPFSLQFPINCSAIVRIDPAKGVDSVTRDMTLDRGWTFLGTVLGPDGKPLAGARGFGLFGWDRSTDEDLKSAEFAVSQFNARQPRTVLFRRLENGLIGVANPPRNNGGSITVKMQRGATVMGRLVDPEGQPRAGVKLDVWFRWKQKEGWQKYFPESIKTDRDGRFRIEGLFPGCGFRLSDPMDERRGTQLSGDALHSGQTTDLGDVRMIIANE